MIVTARIDSVFLPSRKGHGFFQTRCLVPPPPRRGFLGRHLGSWKILEAGAWVCCLQPSVPLAAAPLMVLLTEQKSVGPCQAESREKERSSPCLLGPVHIRRFPTWPQFSFPFRLNTKTSPKTTRTNLYLLSIAPLSHL